MFIYGLGVFFIYMVYLFSHHSKLHQSIILEDMPRLPVAFISVVPHSAIPTKPWPASCWTIFTTSLSREQALFLTKRIPFRTSAPARVTPNPCHCGPGTSIPNVSLGGTDAKANRRFRCKQVSQAPLREVYCGMLQHHWSLSLGTSGTVPLWQSKLPPDISKWSPLGGEGGRHLSWESLRQILPNVLSVLSNLGFWPFILESQFFSLITENICRKVLILSPPEKDGMCSTTQVSTGRWVKKASFTFTGQSTAAEGPWTSDRQLCCYGNRWDQLQD